MHRANNRIAVKASVIYEIEFLTYSLATFPPVYGNTYISSSSDACDIFLPKLNKIYKWQIDRYLSAIHSTREPQMPLRYDKYLCPISRIQNLASFWNLETFQRFKKMENPMWFFYLVVMVFLLLVTVDLWNMGKRFKEEFDFEMRFCKM